MFGFIKKIAILGLISLGLLNNSPVLGADHSITKNNFNFNFAGQSGQISITDNKLGNAASIKWKKIEEYTPQGQKVNYINNFASQNFVWTTPQSVVYGNNNVTSVSINSILNAKYNSTQNIGFNITTYIYSNDTIIIYGNTSINVPKNSIKFTISIGGWPFKNSSNVLQFGAEIRQTNKEGRNKTQNDIKKYKIDKYNRDINDDNKRNHTDRTLIMDDTSFYDMPSFALIDGISTPITVDTYKDDDDDTIGIRWIFPAFSKMVYDPVMGSGTPLYINGLSTIGSNSASNVIISNYLGFMLMAIVSIFIF